MGKLRVLDLFSGIGGFSLGLERTGGFETVAFCEIEPFPRRVLAKHWPEVPCYDDVRTLTADRLHADGIAVDVICGGFPCQPFSSASRGRRVAVDLWPEMFRVIREVRPKFVIAENVGPKPIGQASTDLIGVGYRQKVRRISASDVGADHSRPRWWLCAYPDDESEFSSRFNAEVAVLPKVFAGVWDFGSYSRALRIPYGLPHRVDRLKALGNAVVPQIPELIGNAILASLVRRVAA
jgi:DNA (cytosine-5)-methyltransferase 1